MLCQRFWLELCTKQVASARACTNQFLPCSSSGIALFGMRIVQADSCLNSEQIDTLFISVGSQEGGFLGGGGLFWAGGPKNADFDASCLTPPAFNLFHKCVKCWPKPHLFSVYLTQVCVGLAKTAPVFSLIDGCGVVWCLCVCVGLAKTAHADTFQF